MNTRLIPASIIAQIGENWLRSEHVNSLIAKHLPDASPFSSAECADLGNYLACACRLAPTHAIPKYTQNLVVNLGLMNDALWPSAEILPQGRRFAQEACVRWNANRKLGVSVMKLVVKEAMHYARDYGKFDFLINEAGHFGFAGIWLNQLADMGLIAVIRNTAGRGNEVIPWNGIYPRMGTDPWGYALPTKNSIGFNVVADFALSKISMGTKAQRKRRGEDLAPGCAVNAEAWPTTDPKEARWLLYPDHKAYANALLTEALAALMGGGPPEERALRVKDRRGGASNWIITISLPEYWTCTDDDRYTQLCETLLHIVADNGHARLPGRDLVARERVFEESGERVCMGGPELQALAEHAMQAGMLFDLDDFDVVPD